MNNIEIHFVGGTCSKWDKVYDSTVEDILKWLNDKEDTKLFEANFPNERFCLRKENILFVRIL